MLNFKVFCATVLRTPRARILLSQAMLINPHGRSKRVLLDLKRFQIISFASAHLHLPQTLTELGPHSLAYTGRLRCGLCLKH